MRTLFPVNNKLRYYMYLDWNESVPNFVIKVEAQIAQSFLGKLTAIALLSLNKMAGFSFDEKFMNRHPELEKVFGWHEGIIWSGMNSQTYEFRVPVFKHRPRVTLANLSLLLSIINVVEIESGADYFQPVWINIHVSESIISGCVLPHVADNFTKKIKGKNREFIEIIRRFANFLCESHTESLANLKIDYQHFEIGGIGYHATLVPSENIELGKGFTFNSKNVDHPDQALILLACLMEMTQFEYLPKFEATY